MKTYLVLGGNGFLGKEIVKRLAITNKVVVADFNIDKSEHNKNVVYKQIDFVKCQDFSSYLDGVDEVVHLISTIGPSNNMDEVNKEITENVFPTIRLLNDMVKNRVLNIFFVSSGGTIYGRHSKQPILEDEPKSPICNYGVTKLLIEQYLNLYSIYYGINYKVARLSNPYSEVVKKGKKQGIIPILVDQILAGEEVTIWGDGKDIRDFIYIDDAIEGILKILEYNGQERVFNVGTGIGYSVNEVLEKVQEKLNRKAVKINYTEGRLCDVRNNVLDIHKITSETNWYPKTTLDAGIEKVISKRRR